MRHLPSSPYGSSPSSSSSSSLPPSLSAPSASPSAPSVFLEFHQKHVLWKIKRCARCAGPPGFRAQLLLLSCAHRFKIRPSVIIIFIPTVICRLHCSLPAEVVVSYAPFLFHQKRHPTLKTCSLASVRQHQVFWRKPLRKFGAIEPLFSGPENAAVR